ncbi:MAG: hypothetical protein JRM83_05940 [Nitrososphaerota archaeon]|nr:hypothetical protein [Nitrososphaerota archaeon]
MAAGPGMASQQTLPAKSLARGILSPSSSEFDDDAPGAARTKLRTVPLAPPRDVNFSPDLKRWRQPR